MDTLKIRDVGEKEVDAGTVAEGKAVEVEEILFLDFPRQKILEGQLWPFVSPKWSELPQSLHEDLAKNLAGKWLECKTFSGYTIRLFCTAYLTRTNPSYGLRMAGKSRVSCPDKPGRKVKGIEITNGFGDRKYYNTSEIMEPQGLNIRRIKVYFEPEE